LAHGVHYDQTGWLIEALPATLSEDAAEALMVIGYYMGPVFFNKVAEVGRGMGFFRRLHVLKGVYLGGIWIWAVVLLLAVAIATLLTAQWAARGLSRPLVELADGMRQVARGDEGVIVKPRGSRETRFLTRTFNAMVAQLAAYKRDLAAAERAAAWQDIARIAAHEIRNPLTPIQFAIRRIRERVKGLPEPEQEEMRESLDSILGEVDTLKALASNFSQFAKLPEPSPAPEDLNRLASETVELFSRESRAKFVAELAEGLPQAMADASQMRMVLNNLLKNSVEAMPQGGTVSVRTRDEGGAGDGWVVLEIEDTGTGMDEETLARAADAYFTTKAKGSGLGLAVVHKIVLQHGGRFEIESEPGKGTKVTMRIPAAAGAGSGGE
jgi:nitrogen fixation/metabolism regulation signal transduction histidine kinase